MNATKWLSLILGVSVVCLADSLWSNLHQRQIDRNAEVQLYNQWYQDIAIARDTAASVGADEKPTKGSTFVLKPGAAVSDILQYLKQAQAMTTAPAAYYRVPDSMPLVNLGNLAGNLSNDMQMMYHPVARGATDGASNKQLISERSFLLGDLNLIERKLPKEIRTPGQLEALNAELVALTDEIGRRDQQYLIKQGLLIVSK